MLEQTYMSKGSRKGMPSSSSISSGSGGGGRTNRHTVNLNDDVYRQLGMYVAKHGDTKENTVRQAVMDLVGDERNRFLKAYAPHLTLEHTTSCSIFIEDSELEKTAVVKAKWNDITKPENKNNRSLLHLYCELCNSESCIHVRYSLVIPDTLRIRKEGKLA